MSQSDLLRVLSDGNYHSGEELGAMLGISRAAIWKQLSKLEELGLELESVRGKGYCLKGGLDLLDKASIQADLQAAAGAEIEIRDTVDSTNSVVMDWALTDPRSGLVCLAEKQTAGRGRRGKQWQSPWGKNLYISVLWQFNQGAASLEGLSLLVGLSIAEALEKFGLNNVKLKWPNDILFEKQKLAGILLEMVGDPEGPVQVVIGFGINHKLPLADRDAIDQPVTDVSSLVLEPPSRNTLAAECLNQLFEKLTAFEAGGFQPWAEAWKARDAFADQSINLHLGDNVISGVGRGVNERGGLLLETPSGIEEFYGGEISVRAAS